MFHKMPFILLTLMILIGLFNHLIPIEAQSTLYALSLTIKSLIIFLLPIIIFSLLFKVAVQLAHQATKVIFLILTAVCCSNFISTLLSRAIGGIVYQFDLSVMAPQNMAELAPLWSLQLPKLIGNDKAMLLAVIVGCLMGYCKPALANPMADALGRTVDKVLSLFTTIVPLFIVGFVVKLSHDGALSMIFHDYSIIFMVIFFSLIAYISLLYFLANNLNFSKWTRSLKNMLPAGIAGLSTMSSAAAMPFTILGTQRNSKNKALARSVIPATVNIHLIGDCFAIPILAFAILKSFGLAEPSFTDYLIFAFYFVIAKFSVAAVPGGGILVMLPILEAYMGFNAPMLSLITALYILFDPIITCANVLGNGGFALLIDKLQTRVAKQKTKDRVADSLT